MKHLIVLSFLFFIASGCVKKKSPTPETSVVQEETIVAVIPESEPVDESVVKISTSKLEVADTVAEDTYPPEDFVEALPEEIIEIREPQTSLQKEYDFDQLFPDSIWAEYMIKRGDYLSLIAYKEYNNANEWRRIYQWNREHWEEKGIGPDRDNPNFIYPYRELDLKKPANNAIEWAYDHYAHEVGSGETLWTIAKKVYGDELAWVVLFWDNENVLNSQDGKLIPGMQLKVRSELWPDVE